MNEQNAEATQISPTQYPISEAGTSISFKLLDPDGVDIMITVREPHGAPDADVKAITRAYNVIKRAKEKGWTPVINKQAGGMNSATPPDAPSSPSARIASAPKSAPMQATAPAATQAADLTFVATTLAVEYNAKGDKVGKLKGGAFVKHGIRLWPEAATEIFGFDLSATEIGEYPIEPTKVRYCLNDQSKPQKIVARAA